MKRLINPRTHEVVYLDLVTNSIYFSNSKTAHKAAIEYDSYTHTPKKVTAFAEQDTNFINRVEIEDAKTSEAEMSSTPTINSSTSKNTHNHISTPIPNYTNLNQNEPNTDLMDDYSKYEMIPETEIFDSPDPLIPTLLTPTIKISA